MKKRKLKREILPRPLRGCINAVLIIVLLVISLCAIAWPKSFLQEFRMMEALYLVGPSTIVEHLTDEYPEFDDMVVGETEEGIVFYGRYHYDSWSKNGPKYGYVFSYREKTENVTVLAAPTLMGSMLYGVLPVYVFDEYPEATRAALKLDFTGNHYFYAERTGDGYFRFMLDTSSYNAGYQLFSAISSSNFPLSEKRANLTVTAKVYFYNENEEVIAAETVVVRSTKAAAHIDENP